MRTSSGEFLLSGMRVVIGNKEYEILHSRNGRTIVERDEHLFVVRETKCEDGKRTWRIAPLRGSHYHVTQCPTVHRAG